VPIRGKLISEISPADICDLILQHAPEDQFLEFKSQLLDPRKPRQLDHNRADWVSDLVAFANAEAGDIFVGVEADKQERL
jgi:predicted HTH transcriptional regulator